MAEGKILAGSIIILIGLGMLMQNLFSWFDFKYVWPLLIVAVGLYLVFKGVRGSK